MCSYECDIEGCNEDAIVEDDMCTFYCEDCMERDMEETGQGADDYMTIIDGGE